MGSGERKRGVGTLAILDLLCQSRTVISGPPSTYHWGERGENTVAINPGKKTLGYPLLSANLKRLTRNCMFPMADYHSTGSPGPLSRALPFPATVTLGIKVHT